MALAKTAAGRRARVRLEALEGRLAPAAGLLKDINLTTADGVISPYQGGNFAAVGGTVYFPADDGVHGMELWRSDGTAAGTRLVKDINTTATPSSVLPPSSRPISLTRVGTTVFFVADDGTHGQELWRTDGTAAGTRLVKDVVPAAGPGAVAPPSPPGNLTDVNGSLYFTAPSGTGLGLWKSDGTAAGTVLLRAYAGNTYGPPEIGKPVAFRGAAFFSAPDGLGGTKLWRTNGTPAGTTAVVTVSSPGDLVPYKDRLYFAANSATAGRELFTSDGTAAGTSLLKNINTIESPLMAPPANSNPTSLTVANGLLFFQADDGVTGQELWKSDGTAAGTRLVKDIYAGQYQTTPWLPIPSWPNSSGPTSLTAFQGKLYFVAADAEHGTELWRSDGTAAGTTLVQDLQSGRNPSGDWANSSSPRDLTVAGGRLYFAADDGVHGTQMFRTDGGASGVVLVRGPADPASTSLGFVPPVAPFNFVAAGNLLFFSGTDMLHGRELWKTDGTTSGTSMVRDINLNTLGSSPTEVTSVGGLTYFQAWDAVRGGELWKTDGTPAGTALVKDILPGALGSYPHGLVSYGGRLYFAANDGRADRLFRSDGTAAGTTVVSDLGFAPGGSATTSYSWMDNLTVFNGGLYFTFFHDHVVDLYRTNGTAAGTLRLARLSPVDSGPGIANLTVVKGLLFFTATRTGDTHELWRTDGTVTGTRVVRAFRPGGLGTSGPGHLTALGSTLLFTADDGVRGNELWKSDGTTAGTVLVKDVNPGTAAAFLPSYYFSGTDKGFPVVGGVAYFSADDGVHGGELWKSDGTAKGTVLVKDIFPGSGPLWAGGPATPNTSGISWLTAFNGLVYFSATDGIRGYELWKTDGTSKGTVLVKDIYPGSSASSPVPGIPTNSGYPVNLTVFNGALYFAAIDPQRGRELWVTDGSAAGTRLAAEVMPGPRDGVGISSVPSGRGIWSAGGKLYLIGWDAAHGPELWWFAPPPG